MICSGVDVLGTKPFQQQVEQRGFKICPSIRGDGMQNGVILHPSSYECHQQYLQAGLAMAEVINGSEDLTHSF